MAEGDCRKDHRLSMCASVRKVDRNLVPTTVLFFHLTDLNFVRFFYNMKFVSVFFCLNQFNRDMALA